MDDARRLVAAASPLEGKDTPVATQPMKYGHKPYRSASRRDPAAARAARSGLESLFVNASGGVDA